MPPRLSVVIPTFNEELCIGPTLSGLAARLSDLGISDYEVLVVDNASTDATRERATASGDARVRLLSNAENRGKGFSVRRGMLEASGDLRLMCDADCVTSLTSLPAMLDAVERAPAVAGSRLAEGAQVSVRQPLVRRTLGRTFLQLTRMVMREPVRDVFCGFKLWRADAATAVFSRAEIDGWAFDAEALALARALGHPVAEVGIVWEHRADSRISTAGVILPALRELVACRRRIKRQRIVAASSSNAAVAGSSRAV